MLFRSKWLVRLPAGCRGMALLGPDGGRLGELLATGQQGVVAGLHPDTGVPYSWLRSEQSIPVVDLTELHEALARCAVQQG